MCPLTVTFLLVHPILKNAQPMHTHMCWGTWLREGSEDNGVADGSSGSRKRERGGWPECPWIQATRKAQSWSQLFIQVA